MTASTLEQDLRELSAAEDFLDYFAVPYDPAVVQVNRLHILQRFHDHLTRETLPEREAERRAAYAHWLTRAYQDFVASDVLTEKVFRVFHPRDPQTAYVPVDRIRR